MTERSKGREASTEQSIEQLTARYQLLHTRKIQADERLKHATKDLERLKGEARAAYGTDDLSELTKKLDGMKTENDEKRRKYQRELDRIENELAGVEQRFAAVENPSASEPDAI